MERRTRPPAPERRPTESSAASPRRVGTRDDRTGPHVGPVRITAMRATLGVALVGSVLFGAYAFTIRDASQIPLLAAGLLVLGIVFTVLALTGVVSTYRSARDARSGLALAQAIAGGIAAMIAFGCFAGAIVLALVWRSPA